MATISSWINSIINKRMMGVWGVNIFGVCSMSRMMSMYTLWLGVWICVVWWACVVWTCFFGVSFLGNIASSLTLSNSHFFNTSPKELILSFRIEILFLSINKNFTLHEILYASKSFYVDKSVEDKSSFFLERITILFWTVSFFFFIFKYFFLRKS